MNLLESNKNKILVSARNIINKSTLKLINHYLSKDNKKLTTMYVPLNARRPFVFTEGNYYAMKEKYPVGFNFRPYFLLDDGEITVSISNVFRCIHNCLLDNNERTSEYVKEAKLLHSKNGYKYYCIPMEKDFKKEVFEKSDKYNHFSISEYEMLGDMEAVEALTAMQTILLSKSIQEEESVFKLYQNELQKIGIDMDLVTITETITMLQEENMPETYWMTCLKDRV